MRSLPDACATLQHMEKPGKVSAGTAAEAPSKVSAITSMVGNQVMDTLNEAAGAIVAAKGNGLSDGSYEFLLGPVYVPQDGVSMAAPRARSLLANLRLENQERQGAEPVPIRWLCKRGDEYAEVPGQPAEAIVMESIEAFPGRGVVTVRYHVSRPR